MAPMTLAEHEALIDERDALIDEVENNRDLPTWDARCDEIDTRMANAYPPLVKCPPSLQRQDVQGRLRRSYRLLHVLGILEPLLL